MVRNKRRSVTSADWEGPGTYKLGPDSTLEVTYAIESESRANCTQMEYVEHNQGGRFTTRIRTRSAPSGDDYAQCIWIESEGNDFKGNKAIPGTPKIVKTILSTESAHRNGIPLLEKPQILQSDEVQYQIRIAKLPYRS